MARRVRINCGKAKRNRHARRKSVAVSALSCRLSALFTVLSSFLRDCRLLLIADTAEAIINVNMGAASRKSGRFETVQY